MNVRSLIVPFLLSSVAVADQISAQTGVTASVSGQANGLFPVDEDMEPAGVVAAGIQSGVPASQIEGSAEARFGLLRSFANARLEYVMGTSPATNVSSLSSWSDLVRITSSDRLNGSQAIVRYRVILQGTGSGLGNSLPSNFAAIASYMLSVGFFGSSSSNEIYDDLFAGPAETVDLDFTDTALVVLGETMEFQVQLIASAQVAQPSQPGIYEAEMDISRTLAWGGIAEVTDGVGNPVAFEVESDSGLDWSEPVPEPRAGLLAGLVVLAWIAPMARRRRETPRIRRAPDSREWMRQSLH